MRGVSSQHSRVIRDKGRCMVGGHYPGGEIVEGGMVLDRILKRRDGSSVLRQDKLLWVAVPQCFALIGCQRERLQMARTILGEPLPGLQRPPRHPLLRPDRIESHHELTTGDGVFAKPRG